MLFRRLGWTPADYQAWSDAVLAAGAAFVVPTAWDGETVLRLCIVNPLTTRRRHRARSSTRCADVS